MVATGAALLCAQPPAASSLPDDTVIATADGQPFTAGQLRSLLSSGDPRMNSMAKANPEQFLVNIGILGYLAQEGEKAHLADQSPLKEQLENMRKQALTQAMLNRIRETYNVTDKMIDEYYAQNQDRFTQAWIKVIVIGFCPEVPKAKDTSIEELKKAAQAAVAHDNCSAKRTEQEARDMGTALVGRIRAGEDFVKYVKEFSEDDDSKATDGDFGLVTHDNSFRPEIKAAVFALKDGEISDPIRSGASFYIIKIKEKSVQPRSAVVDPIIQDIKQKHFNDFLADLTKRFKPTIDHPEFFATPAPPKK
ncbi:MAG: peptidylprolyl isomerase [Bryobacteraceae bacterium]